MKKLKVLIGGLFFKNLTGSEMYIYELSKELVKLDCDVSIISSVVGDPLKKMAIKNGVKVFDMRFPPINENFDIIHVQHAPIVEALIHLFPNTPKICTIHSEVIDVENPIIHPSIKKYISIRNRITEYLKIKFGIDNENIVELYNPIDSNKFNTENISDKNYILFVGSLEHLRRNALFDLSNYAKSQNKELWIVGTNHSNYLQELLKEKHIKHFESTYDIDSFVKNCSETGGIMMGRTTIEGWMCGKPGWIYNVDKYGNILNKDLHQVPEDINKFHSDVVAKKIKEEYLKII